MKTIKALTGTMLLTAMASPPLHADETTDTELLRQSHSTAMLITLLHQSEARTILEIFHTLTPENQILALEHIKLLGRFQKSTSTSVPENQENTSTNETKHSNIHPKPKEVNNHEGFYLGISGGKDKIDIADLETSTEGLILGMGLPNNFALELSKYSSTFKNADTWACGIQNVDLETLALYGIWRSSGDIYLKSKAGFLREKATTKDACIEESDSGFSFGLGGGIRFGKIALEAEYTMVEQDLNRLSLSILYNF